MYPYLTRLFKVSCAAALILGIAQVAAAEPHPQFAGSYQLTQVVEDGSQVHVTVKFTLLNPGNTDVKGGILILKDSGPHGLVLGKVATIALLPQLGKQDISESFSVSAAEYARWQHGQPPRFDFLVPGADGAIDVPVQARLVVKPEVKAN